MDSNEVIGIALQNRPIGQSSR